MDVLFQIPAEFSSVDVTGIRSLFRVILVTVIVDLANLVSAVEHRNTRLHEHEGMKHKISLDGRIHLICILLKASLLHAAHGSGGSAETGVTGHGICIVKLSTAVAVLSLSKEEIIDVLFVRTLLHAPPFQGIVIQTPADIVVAAEVVQEHILFGKAA